MEHIIQLDGNRMQHPESAHEYLQKKLQFPSYYGKNLDALFDCLTEIGEPTVLEISDWDSVFPKFRAVLQAASEENSCLRLRTRKQEQL